MAGVILKNIHKIYDKKTQVIENLDLEIIDGEFLVLVGPSGCGKSTVLRMIAGLEEINSGEIFIGDKKVNNVPPKDRDIAMVFQNYALYPHMTVYDNMAFGLKMRKFKKDYIKERVNEAAEILDLHELLDRKPKQLSGGQRQRVALGRAIVREPQVFLMDEPLSNLDAKLRVQTRFELKKLHKKLGATFIYVTHDQVEAMTMGDRIVILDKGKIQQVGTPDEVYHQPENIFVAGFIGSPAMNFLDAEIIGKSGVAGIRPEHFSAGDAGKYKFKVIPELVETLGSEKLVHFDLKDKRVTAKIPSEIDITAGVETIFLVDEDKIILFDKETGQKISS